MADTITPHAVTTIGDLEALYGQPAEAATVKEVARITPHYRAYIEASPFASLATSGPEGLDCSPRDPRVALLFLIPGVGNTLRVNGRAHLSVEPALLDSFAVEDKAPRSVMVMTVDAVYFQCARALVRSDLWNPARHVDPKSLPSAGQILAALSQDRVGGETYDREWSGRAAKTMW